MLLINRVWDLVMGTRVRPNPAPTAVVVAGAAHANQAEITAANKEIAAFEDAYMRASCLIAAAISDNEILSLSDVIDDPIATWAAISQKYARKSKMEKEAAHMALLQFEHIETESANETISRFEVLVQKCRQQEVTTDAELLERMFLSKPNERYTFIKDNYMHSAVQQNLQQIYSSLRDIDFAFQKKEKTPSAGSAAFAEVVRAEVERQTAAAGELFWAQRGKESRPGGRPANPSTTCFCCTEKGHYQRDCKHYKSQCNFCKRTGHLEVACRQKKEGRGHHAGKAPGGEGFFYGGYCNMAEITESDTSRYEAMAGHADNTSREFLADSGASHHICHKREFFHELTLLSEPFSIKQVQGTVAVTHAGIVIVEVDSVHGKVPLRLTNVLYIASLPFNILSLQQLVKGDFIPVFNEIPDKVVLKKILSNGGVEQAALLSKSKAGRLTLDCRILSSTPSQPQGEVLLNTLSMDLLHRRLGHSGEAALRRLLKEDMATGISPVGGTISPCDPCRLGKLTRPPHPSVEFTHGTTYALQLVCMDLAGPVKPRSLGGASYFLGIMDVFTRHSWVYTIKKKSDAAAQIFQWKAVAEGQSKTQLLNLRTDNGGEFTSTEFRSKMALAGVTLQATPPYSPESNSVAERFNRTVQDKTRTIMAAASLPGFLWAEILSATNLLRNMTPVANLACTPFEMWTGSKPDLSVLRVIGCKAFCQIPKAARGGKFNPVCYKGVLVSYSRSSPAYRVWKYDTQKVYDIAAPAFDEDVAPGWWRGPEVPATQDKKPVLFPDVPSSPAAESPPQSEVVDSLPEEDVPSDADSALPRVAATAPVLTPAPAATPGPATILAPVSVPPEEGLRRSTRANRGVPSAKMADMLMVATLETSNADPKTYKQAMRLPDADKWLEACAAEVASLVENKVYEVVDRPASHQVITSKWVFKQKRGMTGAVEKYKARIVARGFMQEEGVDYGDTYSPTVRFESIRMMLAAAASDGLHMEQLDVTTAFLYADLEEEVYLEIPEGMFAEPMPGKVLRLLKALYGLKQSPRMWNLHIDKALGEFGLHRLLADFCVYAVYDGASRVLLGLFVDDMFIIGKQIDLINTVKSFLHSRFKMKDLGAATFLLGMEIRRLPGGDIQLLQETYLGEVLQRFPVDNPRSASTPLPPGCKLSSLDSPESAADKAKMVVIPYRSAVGSLMYLATCTRPDIAAAVSTLSRYNANPGMAHWEGVQHVLRYLKGTSGEGICYRRGEPTTLWGYCDASHLTCPDTGRSRGGYVFLSAGGAISWQSKLLANSSLSSCESEYMQFSTAATEASFLRQLQMQMVGGEPDPYPVRIHADNQPALDILHNPVYHCRTKQILAKYHFVRDRVLKEKECWFEKISADQMGADMLTKHASVGVIRYNKKLIGMM